MKNTVARVAVNVQSIAADKQYSYTVPHALRAQVAPGVRVLVPFGRGNSRLEAIVLSVSETEDTVIATGGSAVFCERGMKFLKETGSCFYLKVDCDELHRRLKNIKTRGIAAAKGMSVEDIFAERSPLYEKYADFTADCGGMHIEDITAVIADKMGKP